MKQEKPGKIVIFFGMFFIVCFLGLRIAQFYWNDANIILDGQRLNVLVARSADQQYKGLGGRKDLGKYDGMIFVYQDAFKIGVVMRDMEFPIDVIWLKDGVVVDIAKDLPLEPGVKDGDFKVYFPRDKADAFLELESGWAEKHDLKIGDTLEFLDQN